MRKASGQEGLRMECLHSMPFYRFIKHSAFLFKGFQEVISEKKQKDDLLNNAAGLIQASQKSLHTKTNLQSGLKPFQTF